MLGEVKIRKLGADSLDALYTALKKCSRLCGRRPGTEHYADGEHSCDHRCGPLRDHRTTRPHTCDSRCRPHACRPKAGEGRLLSLDPLTCELFRERFQRRRTAARALGVEVPHDAFAFSRTRMGATRGTRTR